MIGLLKYYIKKRAYVIGIISTILLLLAIFLLDEGYVYSYTDYYGEIIKRPQSCPITYYAVFSSILVIVVPLFEFSFKMKKVSVDEFYKFPIKKEKLYIVKFIIGLLEIIIPITVFFLFTLLDITLSEHLFNLGAYFVYYLASILVIFASYSLITFVYAKCNTVHDGLINVFLVQFFFIAIAYIVGEIISSPEECMLNSNSAWRCSNYFSYFFVFSPITRLSIYGTAYMEGEAGFSNPLSNSDITSIISVTFFFVIGVVALILLILLLKKEKSEDSMDISNSWFSYKVMLPTFIVVLSALCVSGSGAIFLILVAIPSYIGYAIYRRNFKLKLCDVITIISSIVGGLILGVLVW